ncbi:MAG TPA: class I SAM-dependent methyltransferase [Candidatus Nanopelagicaceae bacterium]|nr:class I SAM-dependent methyltransferase [Candidatus Nanopelagicaceae bacterium]
MTESRSGSAGPKRDSVSAESSARAAQTWWDANAAGYLAEHGDFLAAELVWGPEGVTERELELLAPYDGALAVEIGSGAAQGAKYLSSLGVEVIAVDISMKMLTGSDHDLLVQGDARALPFQDGIFDFGFSAYGALPFLPEAGAVLTEWSRVIKPGGLLVFSVTHPIRWAFPDSPEKDGLTASGSYFDRRAYVEIAEDGSIEYTEHHRTMGDWIAAIAVAGLHLLRLIEPEWKPGNTKIWGGWSPLRGAHLPGTAIFICRHPI